MGHSEKSDGFPRWLKWASGQSAIGVEIFFVISGFLITSLLMKEMRMHGRIDLREFYVRRAYRILPASIVAIVGIHNPLARSHP